MEQYFEVKLEAEDNCKDKEGWYDIYWDGKQRNIPNKQFYVHIKAKGGLKEAYEDVFSKVKEEELKAIYIRKKSTTRPHVF